MTPDEAIFPNSSVLADVVSRAQANPEHQAVQDLDRKLTYAQLLNEVARLGSALSGRGVGEGDRVALLIPNSVDFVVAALGCMWIGAVFVPLAVTDPQSRLESVVSNCAPALVLGSHSTEAQHSESLGGHSVVSVKGLLGEESNTCERIADGSRVVYMIYTSGTTGSPKGVQIGSTAFSAAVHSTTSALGLGGTTITLCVSPFHFDGSYANLFPTLVAGGTVVIRPREALLFPRTFFKTVAQEGITYTGFTPSYLRLLLASRQMPEVDGSTLGMIAFGGEALFVDDLRTLWSHAPALRVFNRYGPTEATIAVTNVELTPRMIEGGTVTIGRPHPGVSFVLIDSEGHVVEEAHHVGELYIGGVQLMNGYWADAALTAEVLRRDVVSGEVLYRTGDLLWRDEDGNYVYVDRVDRVVKRSGVRISLVELNELMNKIDVVRSAACLTFVNEGELGIVAFVTTNADVPDIELRRAARTLIPENMIPDRIERVASMPLNRSNQLDEARLLSEAGLQTYHPSSA